MQITAVYSSNWWLSAICPHEGKLECFVCFVFSSVLLLFYSSIHAFLSMSVCFCLSWPAPVCRTTSLHHIHSSIPAWSVKPLYFSSLVDLKAVSNIQVYFFYISFIFESIFSLHLLKYLKFCMH